MAAYQAALDPLWDYIQGEYQRINIPGLAIGITSREGMLRQGTFGLSNLEGQVPVTPETLFEIGSISKSFACIVALQLREQGLLDFHVPVTEYLPWFDIESDYKPITLHHLMTHTAGLIMGSDSLPDATYAAYALRQTAVSTAPGDYFHYSNDGYKLVGLVLQAVTGQPVPQLLRERILGPLTMVDSTAEITHQVRTRLAQGYEAWYDDRPLTKGGKLAPAAWLESESADGSICSTAEDMCRYLRVLMNAGTPLLTPESFALMSADHVPTGDDLHGEHYGYGLFTQQIDGHACIGHSGGMVGYSAFMFADLEVGLGMVTLVNGPGDSEDLARHCLACLRAVQEGHNLPTADFTDPFEVNNADEFTGTYSIEERDLSFVLHKHGLGLDLDGDILPLEHLEDERFYTPHPDYELFPFGFQRIEDKVVAVTHGARFYSRQGEPVPAAPDYPAHWQAYTGHYKSHNPWQTNFRVMQRQGKLLLIYPWGEEEPLIELKQGVFQVGSDPRSPERLTFGPLINGQAISVNFSGGEYARAFTP